MALFPTLGSQVLPALSRNSDLLLSAGAGLLGGRTAPEQAAGLAQAVGSVGQRNRTAATLRAAGYGDLADGIENGSLSGADAFKLFYAQKLEAQKPKNNFMAVGKNLYNAETGDWVTPPAGIAASDEEWGLTPVWGRDASGKTVLGQVSKAGKFKPLDTGDFTPTPVIQNLDTGTAIIGRNSRTGEVVTNTAKDLAGAAQQGAIGKAQGEAAAGVPAAQMTANEISAQIQSLKADPYLSSTVGPIAGRTPNLSADSQRVQSKIAQLQGGAFLSARQLLKGGGQITDYEGQKAEQAIARMNQAQSPDDFKAALDDFNNAVQSGVQKLQAAAAGGQVAPAPAPAAPPPPSGGVVDYTDYFKSGGL
jgi:hypothetical protein